MGFLNYFIMGALAYGSGWAIRHYILEKNVLDKSKFNKQGLNQDSLKKDTLNTSDQTIETYNLKHPKILIILGAFFSLMLIISALLGRFALDHQGLDFAFIIINSIVATFVFSFGLIPEKIKYEVPD